MPRSHERWRSIRKKGEKVGSEQPETDFRLAPYATIADEIRGCSTIIMKLARHGLIKHLNEADIDLLPHQFMTLLKINGRTVALVELSREMGLDPSTIAPNIEVLVRRGLVQRQRDPQDRRRAPLSVTPEGAELLQQIGKMGEENPLVSALCEMGEEKSQRLAALLRELIDTIAQHTDVDTTLTRALCPHPSHGRHEQ